MKELSSPIKELSSTINKNYIIPLVIVILVGLVIYFRTKENFFINNEIDQIDQIKNTFRGIWGDILDITIPTVKEFKGSNKKSVSNIIRLIPCKTNLFSHRLIKTEMNNINKINYQYGLDEHINNQTSGLQIGNDLSTAKKNLSYGFIITFNPEQLKHNFAYLGIEMKSRNDFNNLKKFNKYKDTIPERKVIEVFTLNNSTSDLLPYFNKGQNKKDIELIGIFEEQNNLDFIKTFKDNKFNLLDLYGNKLITGCKIDKPYCNIELENKGNVRGRNGYIVGKYSPKDKEVIALNQNEEFLKYDNPKECKNNMKNHKSLFTKEINTKKLALDDDLIKNEKEFIKKHLIENTGLKCRQHHSEYNKDFYYGGIDEDEEVKCYADNMECIYYDNKNKCEEETGKIKDIKNKLFNLDPYTEQYPFYIPEDKQESYKSLKGINCIKTKEEEVVCKHIHNRVLSDVITFTINESPEKNAKDILDTRSVLQLRKAPGLGEFTTEQQNEYYKNKYFIESYNKDDYNPHIFFQNIRYFMKIRNKLDPDSQEITTICELIKINKDGSHNSIGYMLDTNNDIYELKPFDRIYMCITKNKKLSYSILDQQNNIISQHIFKDKLEEEFGSPINYYLSNNNTNIFEEPHYTENVAGMVIPYISNIEINLL